MCHPKQQRPEERLSHHRIIISLKDCIKKFPFLSKLWKNKKQQRSFSSCTKQFERLPLFMCPLCLPLDLICHSQTCLLVYRRPSSHHNSTFHSGGRKRSSVGNMSHSKHPKPGTERQITPLSPLDLSDFRECQNKAEVCARMWKIPREGRCGRLGQGAFCTSLHCSLPIGESR